MCLALPAQIIELIDDSDAIVDLGGVRQRVSLVLLDEARLGDWVVIHVGYALSRLSPEEAEATLALIDEVGAMA
ncbi:MAG: HypC/HybG/HupF family hydrogenase formation chaperone [Myxococcales bacterium]|nr:HypC/HybG/HupF family hydrogenase formation chaperone [Myxococcales bacterium]